VFTCKNTVDIEDLVGISPFLGIVFYTFCAYSTQYNLPIQVTSIIDAAPGRISTTHAEGRAIDISCRNWDEFHKNRVRFHLNTLFGMLYGTCRVDSPRVPRVCLIHDAGTGEHFHLQVRKNIIGNFS
jgi:hypothetical protein